MTDSGHQLRENNENIIKLMAILKRQRNEMGYIIDKQESEKTWIQNELEKLSFKLALLTKSLKQRIQAKLNYDRTIHEIEENYSNLVAESGKLLVNLNQEVNYLENIMDKKIGTSGQYEKIVLPMSVETDKPPRIEEDLMPWEKDITSDEAGETETPLSSSTSKSDRDSSPEVRRKSSTPSSRKDSLKEVEQKRRSSSASKPEDQERRRSSSGSKHEVDKRRSSSISNKSRERGEMVEERRRSSGASKSSKPMAGRVSLEEVELLGKRRSGSIPKRDQEEVVEEKRRSSKEVELEGKRRSSAASGQDKASLKGEPLPVIDKTSSVFKSNSPWQEKQETRRQSSASNTNAPWTKEEKRRSSSGSKSSKQRKSIDEDLTQQNINLTSVARENASLEDEFKSKKRKSSSGSKSHDNENQEEKIFAETERRRSSTSSRSTKLYEEVLQQYSGSSGASAAEKLKTNPKSPILEPQHPFAPLPEQETQQDKPKLNRRISYSVDTLMKEDHPLLQAAAAEKGANPRPKKDSLIVTQTKMSVSSTPSKKTNENVVSEMSF